MAPENVFLLALATAAVAFFLGHRHATRKDREIIAALSTRSENQLAEIGMMAGTIESQDTAIRALRAKVAERDAEVLRLVHQIDDLEDELDGDEIEDDEDDDLDLDDEGEDGDESDAQADLERMAAEEEWEEAPHHWTLDPERN